MDIELLGALNNLSLAIELLSESLNPKNKLTSSVGGALQSASIDKKLKMIDEGIRSIKNDNKMIIKNQKEILKNQTHMLSIQKKEHSDGDKHYNNIFGHIQKNNIGSGLKTILMIAAGVLAIGLAFKVIGSVNFLSVIALSIALPLVAKSFETIAKMKELTPENMKNMIKITTTMAISIAIPSWILSTVSSIGLDKLLTIVAISYMFSLISSHLSILVSSTKDIDMKSIAKLSLIMIAISTAISVSSWALNLVLPLSLGQMMTGVLISIMFSLVSNNIGKVIESTKDIKSVDIFRLTVLMSSVSMAIAISSWTLHLVLPLSMGKISTSILIAGMFTVVSYGIKKLLDGISGVSAKEDILKRLAVIMGSVSLAIAISSRVLNLVLPVDPFQILTAIGIAGMFTVISYGIKPLMEGVKGVSIKDILLAGGVLVAIATSIVGVAWILDKSFPDSLKLSTVLLFGVVGIAVSVSSVVMALSFKLINSIGSIKDYVMGGLSVIVIATSIAITAGILSSVGNFNEGSYPSLNWTISVSASLLAFGMGTLALGVIMEATGGASLTLIAAGAVSMSLIALSVVGIGAILSLGGSIYKEGNYPSIGWSTGVGLSLYPMAAAAILIGGIVMTGVGAIGLGLGLLTMDAIALSVVGVAKILSIGGDLYKEGNYPSSNWSKGVMMSMIPLATGSILIGGLISTGIGAIALGAGLIGILGIAKTIQKSSYILSTGVYGKYPDVKWSSGVSSTLGTFGTIMHGVGLKGVLLNKLSSWLGTGPEDLANQIINVAKIFSDAKDVDWNKYPDSNWVESIGMLLSNFIDLASRGGLKGFVGGILSKFTGSITSIAKQIVEVDTILSKGTYTNYPKPDWSNSISTLVKTFKDISDFSIGDTTKGVVNMKLISGGYEELGKGLNKLGGELNKLDIDKLSALKNLTGSVVLMSMMDVDQFNRVIDAFESKSKLLIDITDGLNDNINGARNKLNVVKPNSGNAQDLKTLDDVFNVMSSVDNKLSTIIEYNDNISKYTDEKRTGDIDIKNYKKK